MNFRSLNQLLAQDIVIGIPSLEISDKLYEGYLVGKKSKKSFVLPMLMRSSCILEVVHSNVCGSFEDHNIGETCIFFHLSMSIVERFGSMGSSSKVKYFQSLRDSKWLSKTRVKIKSTCCELWCCSSITTQLLILQRIQLCMVGISTLNLDFTS